MAPSVKRITWYNLPVWAYKTVGHYWRGYKRKPRGYSLRRLCRAVFPDLSRPIFVVGAPRSGTTFLGECLAALPELSYHFEPVATKAASRYVYEQRWSFGKARRFYRRVYAWLMRIHLDGDLRFVEKTPRNALIVPFLYRAFPDAQFIHILRDGRDAALSLSKKPWLKESEGASGKFEPGGFAYGPYRQFWVELGREEAFESTSDIHRCVWSWRRHTEAAIADLADVPPEQVFEIQYEQLVSAPAVQADRLLDFLGISSDASRGLFHEAVGKASPTSVGNWKRGLSDEQLAEIEQEAGDLLRQLNYVDP